MKVLDILQHIQTLDPGQHGAVGYLVQHTLEHIERKKEEVGVEESWTGSLGLADANYYT